MSGLPPEREFRNSAVRLADLTVNTFILEGLTFQNCRIIGPAVLLPQGETSFSHCTWEAPGVDAVLWEIPPGRTEIVGAIAVIDTTFSACTLSLIGLAGPADLRRILEQGFS